MIMAFSFNKFFPRIPTLPPKTKFIKGKEKYRGVFEIQKSGDKTSSGEIGLDIRTHASPKVGQDQVSGGVSVLCWHAAPVAYVPWKPCTKGKKSNSVIRSRSKLSSLIKAWTCLLFQYKKRLLLRCIHHFQGSWSHLQNPSVFRES